MVKLTASFLLVVLLASTSFGQKHHPKVFTSDIDNFWQAYDSIQTTQDSLKQLYYIQTLYIDKGTEGLTAFMKARDYSAALWVKLINKLPKFWNSIRPNTVMVKDKAKEIEKSIEKLKKLYPNLREAQMYFTIGGLRSAGTITEGKVLVGAEIATGNATTDVSEFPTKWLETMFKAQRADNIVPLNIHEYIHTQQIGTPQNLLGAAIKEGACDFITELVIGRLMQDSYMQYGRAHESGLKEKFKQDMFTTTDYSGWLYNGDKTDSVADLGYYMGYAICKSYYNYATNKKQAVKDIVELNYSNKNGVERFLVLSRYYSASIASIVNNKITCGEKVLYPNNKNQNC